MEEFWQKVSSFCIRCLRGIAAREVGFGAVSCVGLGLKFRV